jgi:tetratricopeptide (TPR) repeat protein
LQRSVRSLTLLGCLSVALAGDALVSTPLHAQRVPARRAAAADAAPAPEPFEAEQRRLAAEVASRGTSARAMIPLLELWRGYSTARPGTTRTALEAISQNRRVSPAVRAYARQLLGRTQLRMGEPDASRATFAELGYVQRWRVIGPFDNEGKEGFAREYEPERLRMSPFDLEARYEGRERPVGWRTFPDVGHYGYISFDAVYRPDTNVCAYAETFVVSERPQALSLWLGGGGAIAAWWNGTEVLRDDDYRQPDPDRFVAVVGAHQGPNRLLVKACTAESTWGFYARVAAANGERASGVTINPEADVAQVHAGHGVARLPAAPMAPLAALEAAAAGEGASAGALEDLAQFLALTGADDPAEQRAKQLAERAGDAGPTAARWLLAAELATSRGDASRFIDRAVALAPNDPDVILAQARLVMSGPSPDEALHVLERVPDRGIQALEAAELRADLYEGLGLEETARATLERAAQRAPGAPAWLSIRAHAADTVQSRDQAMELFREALLSRYDDQGLRETVIGDSILRGEIDAAMREIDVYRALSNDSVLRILRVAAWYEALERDDEAMGAYRAALELAPEEADAHVAYGRALLRAGQNELAMQALNAALELRPQDAETRELVEHLQPEERLDEAYAASGEELLARVNEERGYPYRVLQDLTVASVFDSGLGSRFHQFAAQVINDEGGRALRTFPITFDPDVQRYEQQLGEPWYRIYYDTRALVVVFPTSSPATWWSCATASTTWRTATSSRTTTATCTSWWAARPRGAWTTSCARPPRASSSSTSRTCPRCGTSARVEGDVRVDHFHAENIAPLYSEPMMPGATEVRPYLHVSTYRTWEDVGRWYWGLIQDQLTMDDSLRQTVRELVAGAPDLATKVRRIHDWVIDNTRYVGLEFGIHGFKPYRVTQIVQRGFGDCKDKASLLYAMFREAGIDAHIVLCARAATATSATCPRRSRSSITPSPTCPSIDTLHRRNGRVQRRERAAADGPGRDRAGRRPERRRAAPLARRITIDLAADGAGRIEVNETVRGHEAPSWRSTYQAEGTRLDRFERAMRNTFSGIEVDSVEMTGLTDYEVPVTAHYRASVPQLAVRDADGLRVPLTVMGDLVRLLARTETREHAFDLGATTRYVEDRTIRIPAGHDVATLPEGGRVESPFGVFLVTVTREARTVSVHSELTLSRDRVEASEYAEFRAFIQRADSVLRQRLTLSGGR